MKAFRYHGPKTGAKLEDIPQPKPEGSDLLVKVAGAGVCRTDLHILDGAFDQMIRRVPFTMGHETVGWVEEPSSVLPEMKKGDPVIVYPQSTCGLCSACRAGDDMGCELGKFYGLDGTDGGFAEYISVNPRCIVPLPRGQDPAQMAPLADAGLTAYHAVKNAVPILPATGTAVLIGLGGVGQLALQLLRLMSPAEIIAIDLAESKLKPAKELGADHVVKGGDPEAVAKLVTEVSGGKGADLALDIVGDDRSTAIALRLLARGGQYSVVGYGGMLSAPTMQLVAREIRIRGNLVGTYNELTELVKLFVKRNLKVQVEKHALGEIEDVLGRLKNGQIQGRAVLSP